MTDKKWDAAQALELAASLVTPSGTSFFDAAADMLRAAVDQVNMLEGYVWQWERDCAAEHRRAMELVAERDRLAAENVGLAQSLKAVVESEQRLLRELRLARAVVEATRSDSNIATQWGTTDHRDTLAAIFAYDAHVAVKGETT